MRILRLITLLATMLALGACRRDAGASAHLKLGVIGGAEEEVARIALKVARERYGLDADVVVFSDYVTPNAALADGSIDVNAFQHRPFLEQQIKDRGYRLVPVGNTFVYPIAGYSRRIKSLTELKDGASIAVPNDPTNLGRALALLQHQKLIVLKPGVGINGTVADIAENPRRLKIVELEAAMLPRVLADVEVAIINTTYASRVDLVPTRDGLFVEDKESPYVNLLVAREDRRSDERIQKLVKAYQSDEVEATAQRIFKGGAVRGW